MITYTKALPVLTAIREKLAADGKLRESYRPQFAAIISAVKQEAEKEQAVNNSLLLEQAVKEAKQ
jgi:hypothetical protein